MDLGGRDRPRHIHGDGAFHGGPCQFRTGPPEDNRDRMMVGFGVDLHFENGSISSLLSDTGVKNYTLKVKGIKYLSFTNAPETKDVGSDGRIVTEMSVRGVDDVYWKMFGIRFQSGHPFTAGDVESGSRVAVIAMSRARELFNDDEVRGRTIYIKPASIQGDWSGRGCESLLHIRPFRRLGSLPEGYSERVQRICRKYDSSDGTGI